jgi:hypothetical protein
MLIPFAMASKSSVIYTPRDQQIHELLALTPLDTLQLLKLSQTFDQSFTTARKLRQRMQQHQAAGWTHTYTYATASAGQLNYYKLTPTGYRLLNGPDVPLPKRSFFNEVSPALQRHTRHLADVIVQTNVAAARLGVTIHEQQGENQLVLSLGDRVQKPDYSFRLATRDGVFTYFDELDESTEPIASTKQRESLEAKIRFHEDYQNATGERYRVRMIFAKATSRVFQFLQLARRHATRQRSIFYIVLLDKYLSHDSPLTSPLFIDHFNRLQALVPPSASREQLQLPTVPEMLAEPVPVC